MTDPLFPTCSECDPLNKTGCSDRKTACATCIAPQFRCDKTDIENPVCVNCTADEHGCWNHSMACDDCVPPTKYICDKSDEHNPVCRNCTKDEKGCNINKD